MRGGLLAVGVMMACDGGGGGPEGPHATYQADVRPIMEARCLTCHQPGGVGVIDLSYDAADWSDGAPGWAQAAANAVAAGTMPPWLPTDDCHPIEDARGLTDAERAVFADWAAGDFQAGAEADYVAPPVESHPMDERRAAFGEPTLVLASDEAYTPDPASPDDYRCFLLNSLPSDMWLRGLEVAPDQVPYVHHAILYQFWPDQVDDIAEHEARDAADPGPGYPCLENPPADTLVAWAPGQKGEFLPDGIARFGPAGARWLLQIHYNTLGKDPSSVPADRTEVRLWESPVEPAQAVLTIPFANDDIHLPAGESDIEEKATFDVGWVFGDLPFDVPIIGVMAHMHQLGTSISLFAKEDGERRECLLDIPRWDFNWQQSYYFPEDQWFMANSDTVLSMTCGYDNSSANQIVVNGQQGEPRDVYWGEGTQDEMCLTYLLALIPAQFVQ